MLECNVYVAMEKSDHGAVVGEILDSANADSKYLTRHGGWAGCRVRLNLPLHQHLGGTVRLKLVPPLL